MSEQARVDVSPEAARTEAARVELALVQAIEVAIQAWQNSSHVKVALEKARNEAEACATKSKLANEHVKKMRDDNQRTSAALAAAKRSVVQNAAATVEAEANAVNAVEAVAVAEKAVGEAERELAAAQQNIGSLQEVVRVEATNLKHAKKAAHDALAKAEEAEHAETQASEKLQEAEVKATQKQQAAIKASKKASQLRGDVEEAQYAFQTAAAAAEEFEGQGGEWERRTAKTLKDRENEHKRLALLSNKANQAEAGAEAGADEATKHAIVCKDDLENTKQLTIDAAEAGREAATLLAEQQASYDKAEGAAGEAISRQDQAEANLKAARAAEAATTVMRLEQVAVTAKEEEARSRAEEERLTAASGVAQEALQKATEDAAAATAAMKEKTAHVEKVGEREHEAEAKEEVVNELLADFESRVHLLALATYESRMGAPAWWTREEAETTAEVARAARRAAASHDQRSVAAASKDKHQELTVVDKWKCFKVWGAENSASIDMWNFRRCFYNRDGELLSGIGVMVADVVGSALDRGPPDPKQCTVSGEGLGAASIGREASFLILACSPHGIRFEDGGDKFTVNIRFAGQCARVAAKIVDNDDGSYTVTYVPRATGLCTISVLFAGEGLPGSPFSCLVAGREGHKPCAAQCTVSGNALSTVVAHSPAHFSISFRDARGNIAHASELDVWVQPADVPSRNSEPLADAEQHEGFPQEVSQLLMPPGAFDSFVVGTAALDVSRTSDQSSVKIGRLPPGRTLKLSKIEQPTEDGIIRACVRLELEDLEPKDSSTWRDLWPQQQPWRSLSWRAHRISEAKREDEEAEAMAIAYEKYLEVRRCEAASTIAAHYRGNRGRNLANRVSLKRKAAISQAQAALVAAVGVIVPEAPVAAASRGGKKGNDKLGRRGAVGQKTEKTEAVPAKGKKTKPEASTAAAPAPAAPAKKKEESPTKEGKDKKAEAKPASKPEATASPTKAEDESFRRRAATSKDKKGKKASKVVDQEAEAAAAAAKLAADMSTAAARIQAVARGKATRKAAKDANEVAMKAKTDAIARSSRGKKSARSGRRSARSGSQGAKRLPTITETTTSVPAASSADAPLSDKRSAMFSTRSTASPRLKIPSPRLNLVPQEQLFGWVTLAACGECFVVKQTGRLPVHLRQQHEQHWTRRHAIDSHREFAKAKQRDTIAVSKITEARSLPHDHNYVASFSPRVAYFDDVASDPKRIGFAYGGVYPGRLHSKGQLVEKHDVNFSIGIAGNYMLYVNLRQPHTPWASARGNSSDRSLGDPWAISGSPFPLRVAPGKPYPLTTAIDTQRLPFRGQPDVTVSSEQPLLVVEHILYTRDKMGNICDGGGSTVTCGYFDAETSTAVDISDAKPKPTGGDVSPSEHAVGGTAEDLGDGSYRLRWTATKAGSYHLYVKIDGLHVGGSPAMSGLIFFATGGGAGGAVAPGSSVNVRPAQRRGRTHSILPGTPAPVSGTGHVAA